MTSYTFERVHVLFLVERKFSELFRKLDQNRLQNTFSEAFQFSLTSRTLLVGEYRFETINYDTAPKYSTTNFLLGGVNHNLTQHLIVHVRGGESFRSRESWTF